MSLLEDVTHCTCYSSIHGRALTTPFFVNKGHARDPRAQKELRAEGVFLKSHSGASTAANMPLSSDGKARNADPETTQTRHKWWVATYRFAGAGGVIPLM